MCTDFAAKVGRKALWHPVYRMPHKKSPVFVKLAFASFMRYGSIFFKNNVLIA